MTAPITPTQPDTSPLAKFGAFANAIGNLTPIFKTLILSGLAVALYFAFSASHGPTNQEKFAAKYGAFQSSVDSTVKFVKDSMGKEIAVHQQAAESALTKADQQQKYIVNLIKTTPTKQAIDNLKWQIDSLKKATTDSVVLARTVIPKQDTTIAVQDTAIAKKDSTIAADSTQKTLLHKAIFEKDSAFKFQKKSADTLQFRLDHLPAAPKPDKFLGFISLPTRKTAAIAGFTGGVIATLAAIIAIAHAK